MSTPRHIYKPAETGKNGVTDAKNGKSQSNGCLQRMNNPICFSIYGLLACTVGFASHVYQSACITSIERRFQLKSSQAAILPALTDFVGVCTMLFIVHFGTSQHRPRVISILFILTGVGLIFYSVPHFLYEMPPFLKSQVISSNLNSTAEDVVNGLCISGGSDEVIEETCSATDQDDSGALYGQVVWLYIGATVSSLIASFYPIYIIHIDDGVEKKKLPIYMGVLFGVFAVASLVGFGLGSWCLQIPAYMTDPEYNTISIDDPRFLGAWWLGFLILGVLEIIFAIPLFFFPRYLPIPKEEDTEAVGDEEDLTDVMLKSIKFDITQHSSDEGFVKGLLKSIWRVLRNPTLIACYLCYIALSFYYGGFAVFGPKYFQFQFNLNPHATAMIFAVITLPPGLFGNLAGGILVRVFGTTRAKIATIVLVLGIIQMLVEPLGLIFGCSNDDIAGLTVRYDVEPDVKGDLELPNLEAGCNAGCGCKEDYDPVCGSDGVTYVSPCFAGCTDVGQAEIDGTNSTVYFHCSCIAAGAQSMLVAANESVGEMLDQYAVKGSCQGETCGYIVPFVIWCLVILTIGTILANPIFILQLRSVELQDRSMCIALGNVLNKFFGMMPSPILFGALIDSACLFFQSTCGVTGSCFVYDIVRYRFSLIGLGNALRLIGTLFLILAFISVKLQWDVKKTERKKDNGTLEENQPMEIETTA